MFQIMSATFDEGGASGLLLNHLRCYDDGQLLVLDSGTVVPVVEEKTGQLGQSQSQSRTDSLSVADVRGKGMGESGSVFLISPVFWNSWMSVFSLF